MDLNKTKTDVGALWTNEKHVNYLNSMEASFVRKMLEKNDARSMLTYTTSAHHHAPLDRYLPDSFESTCDSSSRTNRKKEIKSTKISTAKDGRNNNNNNNEKRMRRRWCSSRPYGVTQDQVVPQIGNSKSDKDKESRNNQ
ncbi:hypothetical protein FRX31_022771 [Thalictrum thalictroides]|uniref:Uncharacterized protein n=1 Tax=Thalictrum thalictroides TaxID=46969 RepID=A0A7J6VRD6_THATH|nr:hypothetical protein FRX31_022771 [Thalictrum thalictroides]